MDKKTTVNLVRVTVFATLAIGTGLMKVAKGEQHPAAFGLTAAASLTEVGTVLAKFFEERDEEE